MNEQEFTSVWQQLQQRLSRYARSIFARDEEAEDAVQDTFCRLWMRRGDIRSTSHAQALAVTAVKNASIDAHRRRLVRHTVDFEPDKIEVAYTHVAEDVEQTDTFESIEKIVMNSLGERERTVFRLIEYDDLSTVEAAKHLGISDQAVRKALSRARCTIRKQFLKMK
ncbi:MAG: RNA polymerase sigma factor [Muribaculaceae bacterium]